MPVTPNIERRVGACKTLPYCPMSETNLLLYVRTVLTPSHRKEPTCHVLEALTIVPSMRRHGSTEPPNAD